MSAHRQVLLACDGIDLETRDECAEVFRAGPETGPTAQQVRRVVGTATVTTEKAPSTLADEKASLRRLLKKKVGKLHRATDAPYSHIHADLRRHTDGEVINKATVETLHQRLEILDRWLEQA